MADDALQNDQGGNEGDIDFTFADEAEANTLGESFDFYLDAGEPQAGEFESAHVDTAATRGQVQVDMDKLEYDGNDEDGHAGQYEGQAESPLSRGDDAAGSNQQASNLDEIDYDDDNLGAAVETGSQSALESGHDSAEAGSATATYYESVQEPAGELQPGLEQPYVDSETNADVPADLAALDNDFGDSFQDLPDESLQDLPDEPESQMEGEITDHTFGNGDEGLDFDAGELGYSAFPPNVSVTWGDEVCPLFKTDESNDPESFYLSDLGVLDIPLSGFLASIRQSISKWVKKRDEIHLRINELGLEFGETTTDALLSQSTFGHLIALHTVLLKNEDPLATGSLSLTLTTRPNCTLRVEELVEAASSGKGLSSVQPPSPLGQESSPSGQEVYDGDGSPEAASHSIQDGAAEHEDHSGGDDHDSGEVEYTSNVGQDELIDYEESDYGEANYGGTAYGEAAYGDESVNTGEDIYIEEHLGFADPAENTQSIEAAHGESAEEHDAATSEAHLPSYGEHERQGHSASDDLLDFSGERAISNGDVGQLDDGNVTDVSLVQHDIPGPSGPGGLSFQERFERDMDAIVAHWDAQRLESLEHFLRTSPDIFSGSGNPGLSSDDGASDQDLQPNDAGVQGDAAVQDDDDEYLDLESDIKQSFPSADGGLGGTANGIATEAAGAATAEGANISQRASTTPTLGEDEIDYEDDEPAASPPPTTASAAPLEPKKVYKEDEIDWDDEDKIFAPTAALPPASNIPTKRSRDGDEGDDGLRDDGHDAKRQRPQTES